MGDEVDVIVEPARIVVVPSTNRIRGKYRLEDLVDQIPDGYEPKEQDWGEAMGREI